VTPQLQRSRWWLCALIFFLGVLPMLATGRKQVVHAATAVALFARDFHAVRLAWNTENAGEDASLFDVEAGKWVHRHGHASYAMSQAFRDSQNLYTGTVVAAWPARPAAVAPLRLRLAGESSGACRELARTPSAAIDDCR
jgi:hypothetical protein